MNYSADFYPISNYFKNTLLFKNNFLFFSLLVLFCNIKTSAQDLIVLQNGDSINAQVLAADQDMIQYFKELDGSQTVDTLLYSEIKDFQQGYFFNYKSTIETNEEYLFEKWHPIVRMVFNGGLGITNFGSDGNDLNDEERDYLKKLERGKSFSLDFQYFITENKGIGLKYSRLLHRDSVSASLSDNIKIDFVGPSFAYRSPMINSGNLLFTNISLGYVSFSNRVFLDEPFRVKGRGVSAIGDLGYDFKLFEGTYAGAQFSVSATKMIDYRIRDGNGTLLTTSIMRPSTRNEIFFQFYFSLGLRFEINTYENQR